MEALFAHLAPYIRSKVEGHGLGLPQLAMRYFEGFMTQYLKNSPACFLNVIFSRPQQLCCATHDIKYALINTCRN